MVTKKLKKLKKDVEKYEIINNKLEDVEKLKSDVEFTDLVNAELKEINFLVNDLEELALFSGKYDDLNCYMEIHSGAGGTEACDWSNMLYEMYKSFFVKNDFNFEQLDISYGEEAGIKSVSFKVTGDCAYGLLKLESGVHRLVRISPFDAGRRRHTSFASVSVVPEFSNNIDIDIKESDLKIDVYHSSGAGGQSVNTSNSAVRITHLPSKIVVACQNERSQMKNKEIAMEILKNNLYLLELEKQQDKVNDLKNNDVAINFGSQIRSYILEPYKLVKDHRSNFESNNPNKILDGDLKDMLLFNLKELK